MSDQMEDVKGYYDFILPLVLKAGKSKTLRSSSLWSKYSMLKSTLRAKEDIDIGKFFKLKAFLKQQSVGYEAKKSLILDRAEIHKFMTEAPDETYLLIKEIVNAGKVEAELFKMDEVWDIVTIYDRKIEEHLIRKIKEKYPLHKHICEEESKKRESKPTLTDDPTWIIDPIDGTANFVRRMPLTCISVGLVIKKIQLMGVVYIPYLDELFTAFKGQGAFLNGKRIQTSECKEIQKSVMNYEITIARTSDYYYKLYMFRFKHLIRIIQGFRSFGCAVMALCYVACGRTDAYQCDGLFPWDAAAGTLIVREAGGHVVDTSGKEFDLMNPNFLATATKELSDQYMEVERRADEERINSAKENKAIVV